MERIVYCQDDIYINDLNSVKEEIITKVGSGKEFQFGSVSNQEPTFVQEMVAHTKAYFRVSLQTTVLLHPECYRYTPHPHLAVVNMSLSYNTAMQGRVARGCLLSRYTRSFYTN